MNFITYKQKRMSPLVFSGKGWYPCLQLVRGKQANGINTGSNVALKILIKAMWEDCE
jgi:hypothetical protein